MGIILAAMKGNADPKNTSSKKSNAKDDEYKESPDPEEPRVETYKRPGIGNVTKGEKSIGKDEIIGNKKLVFHDEEDYEFFKKRKPFAEACTVQKSAFIKNKPEEVTSECDICKLIGYPNISRNITIYRAHAICYNYERKVPNWTLQILYQDSVSNAGDTGHLKNEVNPMYQSTRFSAKFRSALYDYDDKTKNVNRGHMVASKMFKFDKTAFTHAKFVENTVPQDMHNNRVFWNELEKYDTTVLNLYGKIWLVCGPLYMPKLEANGDWKIEYDVLGGNRLAIPDFLYKIMLTHRTGRNILGAFAIPNRPINCKQTLLTFETTMEFLDNASGLYFLPELDRRLCFDLCPASCRINDCGAQLMKHFYRMFKMKNSINSYDEITKLMYNAGFKNALEYLETMYSLLDKKTELTRGQIFSAFTKHGYKEAIAEGIPSSKQVNPLPGGDYFVKYDTSKKFDSEKFCENRVIDWKDFVEVGVYNKNLFEIKKNDYNLPKMKDAFAAQKDVKTPEFKKERVVKKPLINPTHVPKIMDFNCFGKFQKSTKVETEIKLAKLFRKPDIGAFRHKAKRKVQASDQDSTIASKDGNEIKRVKEDMKRSSAILQVKENVAKKISSTLVKDTKVKTSRPFIEKVDAAAKALKGKINEVQKAESIESMKVTCQSPGIAAFQPYGSTYKDPKEKVEVQVTCTSPNFEAFATRKN